MSFGIFQRMNFLNGKHNLILIFFKYRPFNFYLMINISIVNWALLQLFLYFLVLLGEVIYYQVFFFDLTKELFDLLLAFCDHVVELGLFEGLEGSGRVFLGIKSVFERKQWLFQIRYLLLGLSIPLIQFHKFITVSKPLLNKLLLTPHII